MKSTKATRWVKEKRVVKAEERYDLDKGLEPGQIRLQKFRERTQGYSERSIELAALIREQWLDARTYNVTDAGKRRREDNRALYHELKKEKLKRRGKRRKKQSKKAP